MMPSLPKGCPVTLSLIGVNVLLFAGQFLSQDLLTNLALLHGPSVQSGQYWRIITSGFVHGSFIHIGLNMYLLFILGPQLERGFGSLRFSLTYFGSLFGGALAVLLFNFAQPTLGASGAVLGLAGAMFTTMWVHGFKPTNSPVFGLVILNLALPLLLPLLSLLGIAVPGISFWGHLGGVLAGALIAFVLVWLPSKNRTTLSKNSLSQAAAVVVLLGVACLAAPNLIN